MNKKLVFIFIVCISLILTNSCQEPYIKFNPISEVTEIIVPEELIPEESLDDPQETGIPCTESSGENLVLAEVLPPIEIPLDLPENHDLSDNIPPVRSQGQQGSCTAWATTYYLKSYQEKIQNGYQYDSYEHVMSPAFVYNQIKSNPHCNSGSNIEDALRLLKEQGTATWKNFPYSDDACNNIPSDEIKEIATINKIKDYYTIQTIDSITDQNHTLTNIIKALIYKKQPVIISMKFKNLNFKYKTSDSIYIANSYVETVKKECGHAILITGYDDEINAFKIVNSWGTSWGNKGYAWVSYNFFLPNEHIDFQEGLTGKYVAFDEED